MQTRTTNPSVKGLNQYVSDTGSFNENVQTASYTGVCVKIGVFLLMTLISAVAASAVFFRLLESNSGIVLGFLVAMPFTALICGLVASFSPRMSAVFGSIYCIAYGLLIGALAAILESTGFGSLVLIALLCTVVVAGVMSLLYFSGSVRVGSKFRKVMLTALISLILCQLLVLLIGIFTPSVMSFYINSFWLQLGVSALMVIFPALFILIDLDHITQVVESGLGKKYEWRAAFGLMVTLIWLFLQILRLLLLVVGNRK